MWVKIIHQDGDQLVGTLDNCPIFVYIRPGERVKFHIDDIIDYSLADGDATWTSLLLGARRVGRLQIRDEEVKIIERSLQVRPQVESGTVTMHHVHRFGRARTVPE
jgi:uncharacterized protein YegJ (DUF2314 family)